MQTIIGRSPVTLDTLHEIEPVEQDQSGDSKALIIALGNSQNRQKIVVVQSGPGGTHVNEGGDQSVGHIRLSSGDSFPSPTLL
jgi:hypothetical protein